MRTQDSQIRTITTEKPHIPCTEEFSSLQHLRYRQPQKISLKWMANTTTKDAITKLNKTNKKHNNN